MCYEVRRSKMSPSVRTVPDKDVVSILRLLRVLPSGKVRKRGPRGCYPLGWVRKAPPEMLQQAS